MDNYCYYHKNKYAVEKCTKCGRALCMDCYDVLTISKDSSLCYHCLIDLSKDELRRLQHNVEIIKKQCITILIGCIVGAIIGGICGSFIDSTLICAVLFAMIGSSVGDFLTKFTAAIPKFFVRTGNVAVSGVVGVIKFVVYFVVYALKSWLNTIKVILHGMSKIKHIKKLIDEKTKAISLISDYIKFAKICYYDDVTDIKELRNRHKELVENEYVDMVAKYGERKAESVLKQCVEVIYLEMGKEENE